MVGTVLSVIRRIKVYYISANGDGTLDGDITHVKDISRDTINGKLTTDNGVSSLSTSLSLLQNVAVATMVWVSGPIASGHPLAQ